MYVLDLLKSLLRRWYFLLIGVVATALLAAGAFVAVSPTFDTKTTVLLLPPKSSVGSRGNPYLYLGGLAQAVEVLSTRMNTPQVREPIEQAHPETSIDIGPDTTATGPILAVAVSAKSAADATATAEAVLQQVPTVLTDMQDQLDVPDASRISVLELTPQAEVEEVTRSRDRAVIGIVGLGLAATILLTGFIDGLLLGRIGRRRRLDPEPEWDGSEAPDPDRAANTDDAAATNGRATPSEAPEQPARAGSRRAADQD